MPSRPAQPATFTIVIPTYNEGHDIGTTCQALLQLSPEPDEIIFVDGGSSDETRTVIRQYLTSPSTRLIEEGARRGVAAARNTGVRAARGDVLVFLNADVHLPPDFLARIADHYERGADYVAVDARVINTNSVFGRFIEAQHQYLYGGDKPVGWTEGFSCRRALALQAGLFPEELPGAGGEDGEFVERLSGLTSKGITDKTIVVSHVTPSTWGDFWQQWEGRGVSVPFLRRRVQHMPWPRLIAERIAASLWSVLLAAVAIPPLARAVALGRRSERGWADVPAFLVLNLALQLAHRVGEWKGVARLYRSQPGHAR